MLGKHLSLGSVSRPLYYERMAVGAGPGSLGPWRRMSLPLSLTLFMDEVYVCYEVLHRSRASFPSSIRFGSRCMKNGLID